MRRADPLLLQLVQVAADRRFRHGQLLGQFRQRGKSPDANQFQQTVSTLFGQHGIGFGETNGTPLYSEYPIESERKQADSFTF